MMRCNVPLAKLYPREGGVVASDIFFRPTCKADKNPKPKTQNPKP